MEKNFIKNTNHNFLEDLYNEINQCLNEIKSLIGELRNMRKIVYFIGHFTYTIVASIGQLSNIYEYRSMMIKCYSIEISNEEVKKIEYKQREYCLFVH
jgi:hypothetical protein